MRLSYILEATEVSLPAWNRRLAEIATNPPKPFTGDFLTDPTDAEQRREEEHREYQRENAMYLILKKAVAFHGNNFNGRRWPELEAALIANATAFSRPLLAYLNSIAEEWPEGHKAFIDQMSDRYGGNQETVAYLMKKGVEVPSLTAHWHQFLSPKAIRRHLNTRLKELNDDLQRELAKPKPPPKPEVIDPNAIDDTDEFRIRGSYYTVKQFQNRIRIVQQTQALSDEALMELVLDKRPRTAAVREALHLPWAPSNMRAYVDKHVFKK
jgi:hypothetical protein